MSGKKKPAGKQIALCLLLTAAVDGLGVLLVTLLAVKGIVGEDRVPQALGALAFCAAFAGGLPAGNQRKEIILQKKSLSWVCINFTHTYGRLLCLSKNIPRLDI